MHGHVSVPIRAQKWMGRLYEAIEDSPKAVVHYKRCVFMLPLHVLVLSIHA